MHYDNKRTSGDRRKTVGKWKFPKKNTTFFQCFSLRFLDMFFFFFFNRFSLPNVVQDETDRLPYLLKTSTLLDILHKEKQTTNSALYSVFSLILEHYSVLRNFFHFWNFSESEWPRAVRIRLHICSRHNIPPLQKQAAQIGETSAKRWTNNGIENRSPVDTTPVSGLRCEARTCCVWLVLLSVLQL